MIDISGLTLNPKEVQSISEMVMELVYSYPELNTLHVLDTGIKMKQQIVVVGRMGKTGVKNPNTCNNVTSDPEVVLTQKYWDPERIEDLMTHCNAELNDLWKAYFDKINEYIEIYEIEGTDLANLLSVRLLESIIDLMWRAIWMADTTVAVAGAAASGVLLAADVKFYDYFNGFWKQIFDGVVATTINRVTITENAVTTSKPAQLALAAGAAVGYFEAVKAVADSRLRGDLNTKIYASREIYDNYLASLKKAGENFTIDYTQNGFQSVKWDGYDVINMENIWGNTSREDFVNNTTDNVYDLPHRVVMSTPANLRVGTLSDTDLESLDTWYEKKDRKQYTRYGFTLDSKVVQEHMIAVAY